MLANISRPMLIFRLQQKPMLGAWAVFQFYFTAYEQSEPLFGAYLASRGSSFRSHFIDKRLSEYSKNSISLSTRTSLKEITSAPTKY